MVFEIGAILQVINTHSLACFYVGRVISGLGVGAATTIVPIFAAEMSPKEIRGKLGSFFQLFFAAGVFVSYWVDYGVQVRFLPRSFLFLLSPIYFLPHLFFLSQTPPHIATKLSARQQTNQPSITRQWQIPIGLQLLPGGLVGLGMLLVKESARWLAKRGRTDEALASLVWVRGGEDSALVRAELAEITAGLENEIRATEGVTWRELWLPANRWRLAIAVSLQLCQQLTGNTSLAYYAPQIFKAVGAGDANLLVTGFFGLVKLASVLTFVAFVIDRVGRKTAFMGGAAAMAVLMLIIACVTATHPPGAGAKGISSSGAASIAMVYLEAAAYNLSWGPVAWYVGARLFLPF